VEVFHRFGRFRAGLSGYADWKLMFLEIGFGRIVNVSSFDRLLYFRAFGPPASEIGVSVHSGDSAYERKDFVV